MEESFEQSYKDFIESIKDLPDFEKRGDEFFFQHDDPSARILWAFHRPSGADPSQISDPDPTVSAMAFNNARCSALERYRRLHPEVLTNPSLRIRIQNKSRMLFRSMADEDFGELVQVIQEFPDFIPLACHQILNGRRWKENHGDMIHASRLLELIQDSMDESTLDAFKDRLEQVDEGTGMDQVLELIDKLTNNKKDLHPFVIEHYLSQIRTWIQRENPHPLKKILLEKKLAPLLEN